MMKISRPMSRVPWGMSVSAEMATTSSSVAWSRPRGQGVAALDYPVQVDGTETNSRPVRAAAAAIIALKNGSR